MGTLLWRSSLRYLGRHPLLFGLSIVGVAVGVAVVVAIDIANTSSRRAFELSTGIVAGNATHNIVGSTGYLPDDVYRLLRVRHGVRHIAPVLEGYVTPVEAPEFAMRFLGVDPLAEQGFRTFVTSSSGIDLGSFVSGRPSALVSAPAAERLGLETGDRLDVTVDGIPRSFQIAGTLEANNERSAEATANLLVSDIGTAQYVLGLPGKLSRIDVRALEGDNRIDAIESVLPESARLVQSASRSDTLRQMTRAFETNLTALSLLALIVGMFLTYNTISFSVVQRRTLIGRLRALGVVRQEIFATVIGEAMVIGIIGTIAGLVLGIVLGRGLVVLVTRTINDLYFVLTVRSLEIAPLTWIKGVGLGIAATTLSALPAALSATRTAALSVLRRSEQERSARKRAPVLFLIGIGGVGAGATTLWLFPRGILPSYAGLLFVITGFACAAPAVVLALGPVFKPLFSGLFSIVGRMATGSVAANLSRTSVAIAALAIALSATIGVGIMVDAFRSTVQTWLTGALQADVYIRPPVLSAGQPTSRIRPDIIDTIRMAPGVAESYTVFHVPVQTSAGLSRLTVVETGKRLPTTFQLKSGNPDEAYTAFLDSGAVLISEPYGYRRELGPGDSLQIVTTQGTRSFRIAGVYYDYASDQGVVLMHRRHYLQLFDDHGYSGIALYTDEETATSELIENVRLLSAGEQLLTIQSNESLRAYSLDVFDRTFQITLVLRLLAVVVAFIGVLSALMALQLERAREFGVLRACGMTPAQLTRYVHIQTGYMGLLAGILSTPLGIALAWALIFVINKRSFGWTLQWELGPTLLLQATGVSVIAALLAGLYPAWRVSRSRTGDLMRRE